MSPPSGNDPVAGPVPPPPARPGPDLAAMRARFIADFTGGRIGTAHNTFQHRARVLRQLTRAQAGAARPAPASLPPHPRGH